MTNNDILKKKIIYRSTHRGTKEMDILLGNFVKDCINELDYKDLKDLEKILSIEDEILLRWYYDKKSTISVLNSKISNKLINYKP
tara:strand:+ start:1889 stop:2143 length:255 start_codon:yes stop_codon:yes gene_type:complete